MSMVAVLTGKVDRNANSPQRVRHALQMIEELFITVGTAVDAPMNECDVSAGTESANVRAISLQVQDRDGVDLTGIWMVMVFISTTSGGVPSSSPVFGVATAGTLVGDLSVTTGENVMIFASDTSGLITVPVTYASTGNVYVRSMVLGVLAESDPIAYT